LLSDGNNCADYGEDVENKYGSNGKSQSKSTGWKRQLAAIFITCEVNGLLDAALVYQWAI